MPILTAIQGNNADLLPAILSLYLLEGSTIADVTYGKGVMWQQIDESKYTILKSDLYRQVDETVKAYDFADLPYPNDILDGLVLDPPYMHGGGITTIKESLNKCYLNNNNGHESVIRLYAGGILEAARTLKKGGICIVKTQDETESGKQRFSHVELIHMLEMFGFQVVDLFVMVQTTIPLTRNVEQKSARKNHSYALVARFRR